MFIYDFIPVERPFEPASAALAGHAGELLEAASHAALRHELGHNGDRVEVGPLRTRDEVLVVPVAWRNEQALDDFVRLEGDVELAPLTNGVSHLSLSATYEEPPGRLSRRTDLLRCQRMTEAVVRSFLSLVAAALEHRSDAGAGPRT